MQHNSIIGLYLMSLEVVNKSIKSKVAIFFGYNGQSFNGLQYQRDTGNTVENILHRVLIEHGFILPTNAHCLRRINWSRAGRTDKKVHALCNGISASLQFHDKYIVNKNERTIDYQAVKEYLNAHLPREIRIFGVYKCGKSFDMRHDAFSRVYNYIVPARLFQKYEHFKSGAQVAVEQAISIAERLNRLSQHYLKTHSYHNFTKGYKYKDPRCERFIMSMSVEVVDAGTHTNQEISTELVPQSEGAPQRSPTIPIFIRFTLVGQSFIYHQIRKMIGMLMKILSEDLNEDALKEAFQPERYEPYLVPGEGLYLNRITFQAYNKYQAHHMSIHVHPKDEQQIAQFRAYLENMIMRKEIEEQVFTKWLINRTSYQHEEEEEVQDQSEGEGEGKQQINRDQKHERNDERERSRDQKHEGGKKKNWPKRKGVRTN